MFGSNVEPRRFGSGAAPQTAWSCRKCSAENARYWLKCPRCGCDR